MNLGEFVMETLNPIADMFAGSHPLLRGRGAALVPVADGFTPPAFYDWLLWPFSDNKARCVQAEHQRSSEMRFSKSGSRLRCLYSQGQLAEAGTRISDRARPVTFSSGVRVTHALRSAVRAR